MKTTVGLLGGFVAMVLGAPAFAHHSFAVEYDKEKPVEGTGVISKVEWTNPHMRVYVDCTDEKGVVTRGISSLAVRTASFAADGSRPI
jgi:hypothetical protein